ncbi:L-seryl-tRNA selenium transferase [Aliarcobacter butzleri RM4018]|uniref:L-seryl-tRNA(Sec) selenium transferase n=1 Tax=Aliarcobacter butzleri (strain RM4018) TaxID=367737 RepID=SELA_ALIB4|nr:L-seryl-tRNA(Sec) selenium transferase [Aliarcobacter butzleri]A8EV04.1 RecName: Full=L-seryl-tRNA(Sec) selenium transferase; AltName: Full=Selenocysteine synthase; Short=Sec synthase; AltName: Full=Selenocysteinyl-tRNA(Sec) synthase [Aliarcobacter butzleri RM4018]ABV67777.1 L-seryl-tRNA selenium transferase [Aliarcobacter butzleri RM4018]GGT77588.1 L-seryl-tRNA(Sec) selenium transferase [Aliarcobacter butzleri]SNV30436.1 L-seryl-tRNA(Sec) selenium transferase [Aliarcobacter butzleri]
MSLLKSIPKVDKFIMNEAFEGLSRTLITKIAKKTLEELRNDILNNKIEKIDENTLINEVLDSYKDLTSPSLKSLINATGIIVHTNLGRSLLDEKSLTKAIKIATTYNNLEYDLKKGKRGERYEHITKSLQALTSCEDAIVVNNNASAVFLILNTFCKNKEVIVSRGELVEIGGSFRVPEVMNQSGAKLKEIGTTNKTHLRDYENAICEKTSMLMKVHKSNYSIEGFSSEVSFEVIVKIAQQNNLIDYFDMGSGHIIDLPYNLNKDEPSILDIMKYKPSLLSFSGDKLFGSVQAGIIIGKKELIAKIKKNQLLRMLRVDKITLALLEETLNSYLKNELDSIPTLKMLNTKIETLEQRANNLKEKCENFIKCEVIKTSTMVGGGTTPNKKIPTIALTLEHKNYKPNKLEEILRKNSIISRIENDKVLLDFRTILESDCKKIEEILKNLFESTK